MGNVYAAGPPVVPTPPMGAAPPPPTPGSVSAGPAGTGVTTPPGQDLPPPPEVGPGTFEDLHKKTKGKIQLSMLFAQHWPCCSCL